MINDYRKVRDVCGATLCLFTLCGAGTSKMLAPAGGGFEGQTKHWNTFLNLIKKYSQPKDNSAVISETKTSE